MSLIVKKGNFLRTRVYYTTTSRCPLLHSAQKPYLLHGSWTAIGQLLAKSLEISPAVGDFYGTEIEILADCTGPKFGQHRDHLHCTAK